MAQTGVRHAAPVLPDELVVWEILVHVPVKALLRCRAVCRSWRRVTSTADFRLAHHRRQPSLPLVSFRTPNWVYSSSASQEDALDAFELWRSPVERRPVFRLSDHRHHHPYWVYASCDGLLVVSVSREPLYYICNPATSQWLPLPHLKLCNVLGLYPHSSSGEYRILYQNHMEEDDSTFCYVLTAGSSMAPRVVEKCEATGPLYLTNYRSVLLHGLLHWVHHRDGRTGVLIFDTVGESFTWMGSPADDNGYQPSVVEMDGTLGISQTHDPCGGTVMKIWVLQDYETEMWLMKYQIQLPVMEIRSIAKYGFVDGMILSENGDVLVYSHYNSHMFHCDSTGKLMQKFQWDRVVSKPTRLWFKESLVHHAFFQRNDGVSV